MDIAKNHVNVARAYGIALTGGFALTVMADLESVRTAKDLKALLDSKPEVKKAFGKAKTTDGSDGLFVQIVPPYLCKDDETLAEIHAKVKDARSRPKLEYARNEPSESLLKSAQERGVISPDEVPEVMSIAEAAARYDGKEDVKIEYVAEAVLYKIYRGSYELYKGMALEKFT